MRLCAQARGAATGTNARIPLHWEACAYTCTRNACAYALCTCTCATTTRLTFFAPNTCPGSCSGSGSLRLFEGLASAAPAAFCCLLLLRRMASAGSTCARRARVSAQARARGRARSRLRLPTGTAPVAPRARSRGRAVAHRLLGLLGDGPRAVGNDAAARVRAVRVIIRRALLCAGLLARDGPRAVHRGPPPLRSPALCTREVGHSHGPGP